MTGDEDSVNTLRHKVGELRTPLQQLDYDIFDPLVKARWASRMVNFEEGTVDLEDATMWHALLGGILSSREA